MSKLKRRIIELLKQRPGLLLHEIQDKLMSDMTLDETVDEYECEPHIHIASEVMKLVNKKKLDAQYDHQRQFFRYYLKST